MAGNKAVIYDDFSITKLFLNKQINIFLPTGQTIVVQCKPASSFYDDEDWLIFFSLISKTLTDLQDIFKGIDKVPTFTSTFDYIKLILFKLGKFKQYKKISIALENTLKTILPNIEISYPKKEFIVSTVTITEEIWDYIVYILKLSCGEKVSQPLIFDSAEIKAFYLKQQEYESRINKMRQKKTEERDSLMKVFISICYSFPNFTFDYLFQQTLAQIHWLQKLAAGAVSYSFNEKAFAAGNVKKGKKLDFFIK